MLRSSHYHFRRHTGRHPARWNSPLFSILFFPMAILYHELLLRLFDGDSPFLTLALLRIPLFSIAAGLFLWLILDLIPWRTPARVTGGILLLLGTVILCIERGCRATLGLYFGLVFMGDMTRDVVGTFGSTVWAAFLSMLLFVLLSSVPMIAYLFLRTSILPDRKQDPSTHIVMAVGMAACQLAAFLLSFLSSSANYYTYDFTANTSVPHFGLVTTLRLEIEYALFGTPTVVLDNFIEEPSPTQDPTKPPTDLTQMSSGYHVMDIDFQALAQNTEDDTLHAMHQFFHAVTPSQHNKYTGMFKGKNLILITAEGFSPAAISQELTPTLYRLTHEGFVFNNYYHPDWTMSTSGGEFAILTGIIPNWINGNRAFTASIGKSFPFSLAKQFHSLGYNVPAYHNNGYTYYDRDKTHPNLGYDYMGIGNGLVLERELWPNSDLDMIEATADSYIQDYVDNGTPFHTYYMTVSGHGYYTWADNAISNKNKQIAQAAYPDASEVVQAYIACNLELEYAMAALVDKLEQAGIADDTLIVLSSDHYPYMMVDKRTGVDYYNELRGWSDTERDTSRYRNTLIMWSTSIETPIVVDTPCSSIDLLPTLSNLFDLEYDSRLLSGRDIFATNYQADQFSNCMPLVVFANTGFGTSWITAAGTYEASTGVFTPNEGITVDEDYVNRVKRLVQAKVQYAKLIIQEDYYQIVLDR